MDSSESVMSDGFNSELVFAKTLISNLPISTSATEVGFYAFNEEVLKLFYQSLKVITR